MKNYYRERILEKMDKQIMKGIDKYGMTLEENNNLDIESRLNHLTEELVDALFYIEHLQEYYKISESNNKMNKDAIIRSVASLIYMMAKVDDQELKRKMITELKAINNTVRRML